MPLPNIKESETQPTVQSVSLSERVGHGPLDNVGLVNLNHSRGTSQSEIDNETKQVKPNGSEGKLEKLLSLAVKLLSSLNMTAKAQISQDKAFSQFLARRDREDRLEAKRHEGVIPVGLNGGIGSGIDGEGKPGNGPSPLISGLIGGAVAIALRSIAAGIVAAISSPAVLAGLAAAVAGAAGIAVGKKVADTVFGENAHKRNDDDPFYAPDPKTGVRPAPAKPSWRPEWVQRNLAEPTQRLNKRIADSGYDVFGLFGNNAYSQEEQDLRDKRLSQGQTPEKVDEGLVGQVTGGQSTSPGIDKKTLTNLIISGESKGNPDVMQGAGGKPKGPNQQYGWKSVGLTKMTIGQVLAMSDKVDKRDGKVGRGHATGAAGLYQIIPATLRDLLKGVYGKIPGEPITEKSIFDVETQHRLGQQLLNHSFKVANKSGSVRKDKNGRVLWRRKAGSEEAIIDQVARKWSSMPASHGRSWYGSSDRAGHDLSEVRQAIAKDKQTQSAPARPVHRVSTPPSLKPPAAVNQTPIPVAQNQTPIKLSMNTPSPQQSGSSGVPNPRNNGRNDYYYYFSATA